MKRFVVAIKKILIWCFVGFIVYQGGRIFLISAFMPSPKERAEVFVSYSPPMSIIFLPKHKMITVVNHDSGVCAQLLDQKTNHVGRKVVGDFYYLEDPNAIIDLFPFVPAPKGYEPVLYELEVISTFIGNESCSDALLPTGTHIEAILYRKKDKIISDRYKGALFDWGFYYPDSEAIFFKQEIPDLNYISRLHRVLKNKLTTVR